MNKTIFKLTLLLIINFFVFLPTTQISLASTPNLSNAWDNAGEVGVGAGYEVANSTINDTIAFLIRTALSLLGVIFLGLLVYGGYLWMTDRGNEDQVKRARNLISAAVIGLIIVVSAYAISIFVLENLTSQTLEEGQTDEEPFDAT